MTTEAALELSVISWNIESLGKHFFILKQFVNQFSANLIFLSEPQIYQCDVSQLMAPFAGNFSYHLNSEDQHDAELPLTHPKAKGGTLVIWRNSLSAHIQVLPTTSPSFVSVLISPPGMLPSIHTGVYLPTAGRDGEWLVTLMELEEHIMENMVKHENVAIFLRGDFNASSKNVNRASILAAFMTMSS